MQALCQLQRQGKIRAIGVSNFSLPQLQQACAFVQITSLQVAYSLFWRHPESDLLGYCLRQGIAVLAYSPLAQGLLTGKFLATPNFDALNFDAPNFDVKDTRLKNKLFAEPHYRRAQEALVKVNAIGGTLSMFCGTVSFSVAFTATRGDPHYWSTPGAASAGKHGIP